MSALRVRMIEDMNLAGLAPATQAPTSVRFTGWRPITGAHRTS